MIYVPSITIHYHNLYFDRTITVSLACLMYWKKVDHFMSKSCLPQVENNVTFTIDLASLQQLF